jgi:hypothetical protein
MKDGAEICKKKSLLGMARVVFRGGRTHKKFEKIMFS